MQDYLLQVELETVLPLSDQGSEPFVVEGKHSFEELGLLFVYVPQGFLLSEDGLFGGILSQVTKPCVMQPVGSSSSERARFEKVRHLNGDIRLEVGGALFVVALEVLLLMKVPQE